MSGQTDLINNIFNPKRYGEVDYAIGEIKRLCLVDRKDIKEAIDFGGFNFETYRRERFTKPAADFPRCAKLKFSIFCRGLS